jgi:hypothetical protein
VSFIKASAGKGGEKEMWKGQKNYEREKAFHTGDLLLMFLRRLIYNIGERP